MNFRLRWAMGPRRNKEINTYIGSRNEWDPLEEDVIGRIDNTQIPRPAVDLHTIEYVDREFESQIPSGPFSSEVIALTRDDLEKLCATLTSLGISVRRPDVTSHAKEFGTTEWKTDGFYNYCPRDVLLAISGRESRPIDRLWEECDL